MIRKKPNIVFLDEGTSIGANTIDLSKLKQLGNYTSYFHTEKSQTLKRIQYADIVISNKVALGKKEFAAAKNLKLIAVPATGYNNVDLAAAQKANVRVCNVSGYAAVATSEHAILFLLAFGHRLLEYHETVTSKAWQKSKQACYTAYSYHNLEGKTLGIVGFGAIGKRVAKVAKALGMKVVIAKIPGRQYKKEANRITLDALLKTSDYVSLNCPLTQHTLKLINAKRLRLMKPTAVLINTARGDVVDELAVAKALQKNKLAGYAADAFSTEPPPKNHPLFHAKIKNKVIFTPHVAWASQEACEVLCDELTKNIASFLKGKPRNLVL